MKNIKKLSAIGAAALLSMFSLTGCGANEYIGKWEAKTLTMNGQTYEGDVNGTPVGVAFQIEFKEDGKGEVLVMGQDNEQITWEQNGDTINAKSTDESKNDDDQKLEFKKDGENLTVQQGDTSVVLTKVDEFTKAN